MGAYIGVPVVVFLLVLLSFGIWWALAAVVGVVIVQWVMFSAGLFDP